MIKNLSLHHYPYNSRRTAMHARNGMVATSTPLAAEAGKKVLSAGGNAVDAAIVTAAALTVSEPTSNGIGGDAFAIVWMKKELHGLNASGKAPGNASVRALKEKGYDTMPRFGFEPVTVPGVPSAWAALSERFGVLPLEAVLAPAIALAEEGFPVSPTVAEGWRGAFKGYKRILKAPMHEAFFKTFTKDGETPGAGELFRLPDHAKTLRELADTQCASFYRGDIAEKIDAFSKAHDGFLRKEDLEKHSVEWVTPLSVNYRGVDVYELPPNTQGMVALEALGILENFDGGTLDDMDALHRQIEALKLAFADGKRYIADHDHMTIHEGHLLDPDTLRKRSKEITDEACDPKPFAFKDHGTVYLATADKDGNMVSYIQSNYMGF
ncbi:MAG: gamma-glutamyltransferase family protein, partial [Bacillota bacterium]